MGRNYMKSNFEFLNKDMDTQVLFEEASNAEDLYTIGKFSNEFESIRKIIEAVVFNGLRLQLCRCQLLQYT